MRNGMSEKEAGYLGYLASKKSLEEKRAITIQNYNLNPNYCNYCGKPLDYNHRCGKFCNSSCAASFNNKNRKHTEKSKQKASLSLKKYYKDDVSSEKEVKNKIKYCKYCGAEKGKCKDLYVCSKWRIFKSLIKFGFNNDVIGTNDIIDEFYKIKNIIENFYNDFSSNNEMLKKIFNYTSGSANFIKLLKSLDIEIKSINESVSQAWLVGRLSNNNNINNYKCGWHTTWNNKDVYLRSSYEFDFAKELDNNKILYEVESLKIKYFDTYDNKYRCAIPDFYLPETNEIIEIKSSWTLSGRLQNMKDKFTEYKNLGYKPVLYLDKQRIDNIFELTDDNIKV